MLDSKSVAAFLKREIPLRPTLAMVLGSGFQHALARLEPAFELAYGQVPGFPTVGVTGHAGKLVAGHFGDVPVLIFKGRAHYYEGHEMERLVFPIRVLADFGIRSLLLTNASGAINKSYRPGDFMILEDHINFMGDNPLRGPALPGLPRFVDLTRVYNRPLTAFVKKAAGESKLRWHAGTYLAVSGPNYETPAEIRAFQRLGADAVGMSTVPEAIVACQCGLAVAGVSCITNVAGGDRKTGTLVHQDVLAMGEKKKAEVANFLHGFAQLCAKK
jgi:purine-nucleoside phosphorylase